MKKEPLLYLCHRIPFPPNKGDKITTYNLLKYLSKRYSIYLGCFIDDPFDHQYQQEVKAFCEEVHFESIDTRSQAISGLYALTSQQSVSTAHYRSKDFQSWVDNIIDKENIEKIFVYSSGMAQFVDTDKYQNKTRLLDMADVDSDKWRQYAQNKPWYTSWIYQREQRILANYEANLCRDFNGCTLITDQEAALFRSMMKAEYAEKIHTLSNGVDTDYFSPNAEYDFTDKPTVLGPAISFIGAMDYWANEDAVIWFSEYVWPSLKAAMPKLVFYIVGGKPSDKVKALAKFDDVIVTGRVVDVRPFVAHSFACVAPLRIARGVQNKVLEAMSMAKPVVMTSMAQEGIDMPELQNALVIDDPMQTVKAIVELSHQNTEVLCKNNRDWIVKHYSWDGALAKLDTLLDKELV